MKNQQKQTLMAFGVLVATCILSDIRISDRAIGMRSRISLRPGRSWLSTAEEKDWLKEPSSHRSISRSGWALIRSTRR